MILLCPICNKELSTRRAFSIHLSRSHEFATELEKETLSVYTIFGKDEVEKLKNDYISGKYSINGLPFDICKFLDLSGLKRSSKEERATERYKQKYKNSILQKYGVENISQSKIIQKKKEETCAKKHGSYEEYLVAQRSHMREGYNGYVKSREHHETYLKVEQTCLERYGYKNFGLGREAKEKSKIKRKETIASWEYEERLQRTAKARASVNHRGGFSSKPEKRVRKALVDLDIESKYNQNLFNYNWDIVIGNFIIEVQGVMWHAKKDRYKANDLIMGRILASDIWEKDKRKRCKAEENGFVVIEIWEDEIAKCNDDDLVVLVEERLKQNGF